jgi:hypothetical protein
VAEARSVPFQRDFLRRVMSALLFRALPVFEIASLLLAFDQVPSLIENTDHRVM